MKRFFALGLTLALAGCGNTAVENELVGQAKKISQNTPLVCLDFKSVDISLGVMRGGTGSMSTQDMWLTITDESLLPVIKRAVETGALVKVRYNTRRFAPCSDDHWLTAIEIVQ